MSLIRITRKFAFEMAHALPNYIGPCSNLHGHSYKLFITVKGAVDENRLDGHGGMVMDFSTLGEIVKRVVVEKFDHAVMLERSAKDILPQVDHPLFRKMITVPFAPTSENILLFIADLLFHHIPPGISLYSMKLCETENSFAEWFSEDNI